MKIRIFKRTMRLSLLGLAIYLLLMVLLCNLGFWQLERSEQKRQLIERQKAAMAEPSLELNRQLDIDAQALRYRPVRVVGRYDGEHQFLVDNQVMDGKNGYFVMTPFLLEGQNKAVLVNRGWVPAGRDRRELPDVRLSMQPGVVNGRINQFPAVGIKLKGAEIPGDTWPSVVQVIDPKVLSEKLGHGLWDFQVELDVHAAEGYQRDWKIHIPIPPEKHVAYAVQWFGLALTLSVLFIWISVRKKQ